MASSSLLTQIEELETLVRRAEEREREREAACERRAHLDAQIHRLEESLLRIDQKLLVETAGRGGAIAGALRASGDAERLVLEERASAMRTKITELQWDRDAASHREDTLERDPTAGAQARLRERLRSLVASLQRNPGVPQREVDRYRKRIAELVRRRRQRLDGIVARLEQARDYVVTASACLERFLEDGEAGGDALPDRSTSMRTARYCEMARLAVAEAREDLISLARAWPEMGALAALPDWERLPLGELRGRVEALAKPEAARDELHGAIAMARALALWVDELRDRTAGAPLPV